MIWVRPGSSLLPLYLTLEHPFKAGGLPARNSFPARWDEGSGWSPMRTVALPWDEGSLAAVVRALLGSASFRTEEGLPEAVGAMVPDPASLLLSLQVMES